ncbi:MAG TPA: hypothetical protein VHM02_05180 [Thermoanaerobaculia bacterium]|nr:hypothetical protein [Thermoanaerobaculia bacterium]
MSPRPVPAVAASTVLALAALVAACAQPSPEERVSALRAGYHAQLNSFLVREEPIATPETAPAEEPEAAAAEADAAAAPSETAEPAEPAAEPAAPAPAVRQDVVLDVLVRNDNDERLPGLTLDVEQADAQRQVKTSYRIWVDVSGIAPGTESAVTHTLQDVDYAPGDGFAVEVRQAIPPEQRDQYREFTEAAPQP